MNCAPPRQLTQPLAPRSVTLFGNRFPAEMWIRLGPPSVTGVLVRRKFGHRDTQRRRPCGSGGRGWGDAATSQGAPRVAGSHQDWEEMRRGSTLEPRGPADALGLASGLRNGERVNSCCSEPPGLGCFVVAATGH